MSALHATELPSPVPHAASPDTAISPKDDLIAMYYALRAATARQGNPTPRKLGGTSQPITATPSSTRGVACSADMDASMLTSPAASLGKDSDEENAVSVSNGLVHARSGSSGTSSLTRDDGVTNGAAEDAGTGAWARAIE